MLHLLLKHKDQCLLGCLPAGSDVPGSFPWGRVVNVQGHLRRGGPPYNHVSKAIIRLRELGLVEVTRGRSGGVRISADGRLATVGWLLRQLDTRSDLAGCETPSGPCPLSGGCGLRAALRRAREAFYSELDDLVISTLPHSQLRTRR